jgi:hypothetical protein
VSELFVESGVNTSGSLEVAIVNVRLSVSGLTCEDAGSVEETETCEEDVSEEKGEHAASRRVMQRNKAVILGEDFISLLFISILL